MSACRCSGCGRFVARSDTSLIDWSGMFPGMGSAYYHPCSSDPTLPCGPVRDEAS